MRTNVEKITKTKGLTKTISKNLKMHTRIEMKRQKDGRNLYEDIQKRNFNPDITWIKDKSLGNSDDLPEPEVLIQESIKDIKEVLDNLENYRKN